MKYTKGDYYERALEEQQKDNWSRAVDLINTGKKQNCGMCYWLIGYTLDNGYWGTKNHKRAVKQFIKGMELNNPRCVAEIMKIQKLEYRELIAGSMQDDMESFVLESDDNYAKGIFYEYSEFDEEKAFEFYLMAAKKGDCFAEFEVAHYHNCNHIQWYRLAAHKGFALAQGNLFNDDQDISEDEKIYWGRKAAAQNYGQLQFQLGLWFLKVHKFQNTAASLYWFTKACNDDNIRQDALDELKKHKEMFRKIENCRDSCMTIVAIQTIKNQHTFPKDVVILFAKYLWKTRDDDIWENNKNMKK